MPFEQSSPSAIRIYVECPRYYSASTLPVTRCNVKIYRPVKTVSYLMDVDLDVHNTYRENLIKFEGGPVSVQVVCNRLEEEKCLAITKYISSLLD